MRTAAALVGVGLFALGFAITSGFVGLLGGLGVAIGLAGAMVGLPWFARTMASITRPVLARLAPASGELAANRLARQPGRSATTAGLVAVTLALVLMVQTFSVSSRPALAAVVRRLRRRHPVYGGTTAALSPDVVARRSWRPVSAVSEGATG